MSKVKIQQPVIHVPTFKTFNIAGYLLKKKLDVLGLKVPMGMLDGWYYFTDLEGWGTILFDMVFKSTLYKGNRFDCENYALKAMTVCAERYGLNTMAVVIGDIPQGRHGFNMFYHGAKPGESGFMLWEPNAGFPESGEAFEIGQYGYKPELILI